MIEMDGLALMGLAPPMAHGPPAQDAADDTGGFADIIAAALAAAAGGGAEQQPDASNAPAEIDLINLMGLLESLSGDPTAPEPIQEGTQQVAWPDRSAEASAMQALTNGTAEFAVAGAWPLAPVIRAVETPSETVAPSIALPLASARTTSSAGGAAQQLAADLPAPQAQAAVPAATQLAADLSAPQAQAAVPAAPDTAVLVATSQSAEAGGVPPATYGPQGQPLETGLTGTSDLGGPVNHEAGTPAVATAPIELPGEWSPPTLLEPSADLNGVKQPDAAVTPVTGAPAGVQDDLAVGLGAGQRIDALSVGAGQSAEPVDAAEAPQLAARLADSVAGAVRVGTREFRMRLNPPELGHLNVRVVETPEGVRVTVVAATAEASELIQQQLPQLRLALEARDVRVGGLDAFQADLGDAGEAAAERHSRSDDGSGDEPLWSPLAAMQGDAEPEVSMEPRVIAGTVDLMA